MLKEGVKVGDETMAPEEIVANEIDNYTRLLRIKKVNKEDNPVLNHEINISEIKLERYGYSDLSKFQP